MLTYEPDDTLAHRLDPRTKLLLQVGFAVAVFSVGSPPLLPVLATLPLAAIAVARVSPLAIVRTFWPMLAVLAVAPLVGGVQFGPPWFDVAAAERSIVAVTRVALVLGLSVGYIRSTSARDSRAAVQRTVPGRPGQLLGVGVGLTIRYFPLLRRDVATLWDAIRARGGDRRSTVETGRLVAAGGLRRAVERSDRLAVALQARCFAWNATLPELRFSAVDYLIIALSVGLALSPLARFAIGRL